MQPLDNRHPDAALATGMHLFGVLGTKKHPDANKRISLVQELYFGQILHPDAIWRINCLLDAPDFFLVASNPKCNPRAIYSAIQLQNRTLPGSALSVKTLNKSPLY